MVIAKGCLKDTKSSLWSLWPFLTCKTKKVSHHSLVSSIP